MYGMRADEPKVVVRFGVADWAVVDGAAALCGVATSGLVREAAVRAAVDVAREVLAGRVRIRARSGVEQASVQRVTPVGVPAPAESRSRSALKAEGAGRRDRYVRPVGVAAALREARGV